MLTMEGTSPRNVWVDQDGWDSDSELALQEAYTEETGYSLPGAPDDDSYMDAKWRPVFERYDDLTGSRRLTIRTDLPSGCDLYIDDVRFIELPEGEDE